MKKPAVAFTVCDENNEKYARMLENSLRKFHSSEELPLHIVKGKELRGYLKDDPQFFYRQKPILGEKYLKEYDLVLGLDCDQIVCGKLDYILKTSDYDVGCVLNYNRIDPKTYGLIQGWGIQPIEYVNCGLVAMRSEKFVHEWKVWCFSPQFERMQYREQDGLNIKVYHGNWNCRIFDHGDGIARMHSWWGLISKGEWLKAKMRGEEIIVPKGEGNTPFPPIDMSIKIIHFGEGNNIPNKMNYRTKFSEEVSKRLDYLVGDEK